MSQILDDAIDLGPRFRSRRTGFAGVHDRAQRRLLSNRLGLLFELLDDRVDIAPCLSQPLVQSLVEALLEHLFALGERLLALRQLRVGLVEGTLISFELRSLALERPRLRIEARQVRLQALLIIAEIATRGG